MGKKFLLIILLLLWTTSIMSQENVSTNQMPYAEGSTSNFEVVITYNNIEPNKEANLTFYISDFKTNAPIENAKLEMDITGVDNSKINILPSGDPGIYEVLVEFPEIKKYDFLFNITSGDINDLIAINEVDLAHNEQINIAGTTEDKSFIVKAFENWLWIILSIILISIIAFIFYRIGKRSNSKINLPQTYDTTNKYEV